MYTTLSSTPLVQEAMLAEEQLFFIEGYMDLNHSPMNSDSKDSVPSHSVVGSICPLSVHENLGEQSRRAQETPSVMLDWLAQLVTKVGNSNRALE